VESIVQGLEAASNLLLWYLGQSANLLKCTRDTFLTTCDEDASRNDALVRLASQQLLVLDTLKQLLGDIRC
jgi:hypothetical protein